MKRSFQYILIVLVLCITAHLIGAPENTPPPLSQPGVYQGYSFQQYKGYSYTSHYILTRDSILLATDIYLPKHLEKGKKVPTILYLTRYVRSIQAKAPLNLLKDPIFGDVGEDEIKFFTGYGYACVVVDVRGTGASTGARKMEFSPEEVADGKDIVDWIVAQKWSDGKVGATGVSYVGTTAELLLANRHPNVKACITRSNIYDLYNDILFPGGVCQGPFVKVWGAATAALDHNDFKPFTDKANLLVGIHTVKGDKERKIWKQALAEHLKNFDVTSGLQTITFRDDVQAPLNASPNDFSVHAKVKEIQASGTPIYRMDGWYDAALAKGCLDAWLNTSNTKKVLIGPWDHGPADDVSPFAKSKKVKFDIYDEMLRFFDHYLKSIDNGIDKEPVLTYYTVGEEKWNTSNSWPLANQQVQSMYLTGNKGLSSVSENAPQEILNYKIDYTATSGNSSRWNSLTPTYKHGPSNYADRRKEDEKLLCFTSEKLANATTITGHPVVHLKLAANTTDATVFCYLEDVGPDSTVYYVTEGMFRPMHCKIKDNGIYKTAYPDHTYNKGDVTVCKPGETLDLTFDLLPISYQFQKGHCIRVSIAGADEHFNLPNPKPDTFMVSTSGKNGSYIELPVVGN